MIFKLWFFLLHKADVMSPFIEPSAEKFAEPRGKSFFFLI